LRFHRLSLSTDFRYSLCRKEVVAVRSIMTAFAEAAPLETGGQNRMGKDRFGRASLRALSRRERLYHRT